MIKKNKILAVIPARGGSKRLPRKNILSLAGKPLICWSIEAALGCKYIDRVIVSTEDKEIADVSKSSGADVPFLRPNELATDKITTIDVILHLFDILKTTDDYYDYIVLLQPTSPLRTAAHITTALEQLIENDQSAIVSVCQAEHHPLWCNTLPKDRSMSSFLRKDLHNIRSQDLPDYYRLNGAVYICDTELLKKEETFLLSQDCSAFIMSQEDSIDIDTKEDFDRAQLIFDDCIVEKSKFVDQLFYAYLHQGFGKMRKADIDVLMFDIFVKRHCLRYNGDLLINGEVNYSRIDKKIIHDLSVELMLSEDVVSKYIEELG